MKPLISIIVPVYNSKAYLDDCISSIIKQTYTNIEILLIDNLSTDGSLKIMERARENDKRIEIFSENKAGVGNARNMGLRKASGEYIVFVDSDDTIEENMVDSFVTTALTTNADIVCSGFNRVHESFKVSIIPPDGTDLEKDYLQLCFNEVKGGKFITTTIWAKLFKADIIKNNHIEFRINRHDDTPFFIETVYYSNNIAFINKPLYNYYVRPNSLTNSSLSEERLACLYKADDIILKLLIDKNIYKRYYSDYNYYHFMRIILYGGYNRFYISNNDMDSLDYDIFFRQLKTQKIFFSSFSARKLPSDQRMRFRIMKYSFFLSRFSPTLPHILFRLFEHYR